MRGRWTTIIRFVQENQTALRDLRIQEELRTRFLSLALEVALEMVSGK